MKTLDWRLPLLVFILGLCLGSAAAWKWQDNSFNRRMAEQEAAYQSERNQSAAKVIDWQEKQQAQRRALEDRLQANDVAHYKEIRDAQNTQARLRDRLATADVRLSVQLANPGAGSCPVSADPISSRLVHGATRAELDPAYAQRIIGITDAGDQGLIALKACQAYAQEVSR